MSHDDHGAGVIEGDVPHRQIKPAPPEAPVPRLQRLGQLGGVAWQAAGDRAGVRPPRRSAQRPRDVRNHHAPVQSSPEGQEREESRQLHLYPPSSAWMSLNVTTRITAPISSSPAIVAALCTATGTGRPRICSLRRNRNCPPSTIGSGRKLITARFTLTSAMKNSSQIS